jgi:hypothetical protein
MLTTDKNAKFLESELNFTDTDKTENDLLQLGFKQAFMFRPGAFIPLKGIKSRTKSYQFKYDYFMWLVKGIKSA